MPGYIFVDKFLKEIQMIVIVIFCVWASYSQNFLNSNLLLISLNLLTKFTLAKKLYNFLSSYSDTPFL